MPFLLKLATRNLWRNRRRTVLTFSSLALGIMWLIVVDSITHGLTGRGVENIVNFETGELQVHAPGYFEDRESLPIDRVLPRDAALQAVLSAEGVAAAAPRVVAPARLNVGWEEFPVVAVAIDPARDGDALDLSPNMEGSMPAQGAFEAAIGSGLAELLDIHPGDWITLVMRTRSEAIQALDLRVVGVIDTPNPNVNDNHVYLPLDTADAALEMNGGVTELVVRLEPGASLESAVSNVQEALAGAGIDAEVVTWRQAAAAFLTVTRTSSMSDRMLVFVILIIALVGVTNTILLGALERKREIGTMKAMGLRESEIVRLFLLEATGIGLIAAALGSAIGAGVNFYLVRVGIDLSNIMGDLDLGFPIGGTLYGAWNIATFIWASAAGIVTCWIAGYLPARRASKLDPAASMRE